MPPFKVRLFSRSALRADKGRRFTGNDHIVRVTDGLRTSANGEVLHDGLLFTVEVGAADIHEAIRISRGLASRVADQLSLAQSCAIEEPETLFALSLDSSEGYLQLAQVIRSVPELRRIRRPFSDEAMHPVMDLLEKVRLSDQNRNITPRLDRALRYLRRSNLETDPIDKFEDLSNALQSLEPRLREKYHSSTKFQRDCASCSVPLICKSCSEPVMGQDNFSGVDHLVSTILGRSKKDARRLRDKRNDIVHSTQEFGSILEDLPELTELAAQALVIGILELIGADPSLRAKLSRHTLGIFGTPELVAIVALHGASREKIEQQQNYPAVRLHGAEIVRPNRELVDTDANDLEAIAFHVDVENYPGDWDPLQASISFPRDPEDGGPLPQLLIQKAVRRQAITSEDLIKGD
jgi:hypothetical protein